MSSHVQQQNKLRSAYSPGGGGPNGQLSARGTSFDIEALP